MESVLVALIVAGVAVLGQWLLRRQVYQRQDELITRINSVHKIVNQQRTDMLRYEAALKAALRHAGVDIPADQSLEQGP